MRERDIEDYLVKRVKEARGAVRKVKWIGRSKAPDRLVLLPITPTPQGTFKYVPRSAWVELKKPGGLKTFPKNAHEEAQAREHERMRRFGETVHVIDSFEGVDALVEGRL